MRAFLMSPLYSCPHCRTQNFYTRARIRLVAKVPLECWKCRKGIKKGKGKNAAKAKK